MNKQNRLKGKIYNGKKKIDRKWTYNINRSSKALKEPCNCKIKNKNNSKLKCSELTEVHRKL